MWFMAKEGRTIIKDSISSIVCSRSDVIIIASICQACIPGTILTQYIVNSLTLITAPEIGDLIILTFTVAQRG